jgi:hypothetical protein
LEVSRYTVSRGKAKCYFAFASGAAAEASDDGGETKFVDVEPGNGCDIEDDSARRRLQRAGEAGD